MPIFGRKKNKKLKRKLAQSISTQNDTLRRLREFEKKFGDVESELTHLRATSTTYSEENDKLHKTLTKALETVDKLRDREVKQRRKIRQLRRDAKVLVEKAHARSAENESVPTLVLVKN